MQNLTIIGGGFAGVWAAMSAAATRNSEAASDLAIQLISPNGHLCIRPRLYEGASQDVLVPLEPLLQEISVNLVNDTVVNLGADNVVLRDAGVSYFDRCILAAGSLIRPPQLKAGLEHGFFVDDFAATQKLDTHLEKRMGAKNAEETVVVVGASFSGIEIVTKLRQRLGEKVRLVLIDRNDRPAAGLGQTLEGPVAEALKLANVETVCDVSPVTLSPRVLTLSNGQELQSHTVIFATGFQASALTRQLGLECDLAGRILVESDLKAAPNSNIFAAGDVASAFTDAEHRTLMSCQHAMPMGVAAGRNAVLDLLGKATQPYAQSFYATCIDLGAAGAVFTNGWDRQIIKSGAEGAEMKTQINTQWIYPPAPSIGREKIFEMVQEGQ